MAVTDQQKLDFLLKKIGYTKTKTGSVVGTGAISGTPKQPFAEAIPSPLIIANSALWNEADSIPATAPGSDTTQVKVYLAGTSGLRMTADSTSSGQRAFIAYTTYNNTSSARLTNWIDTQFGSSYLIKVYKGDPNSGGVALSAAGSGSNDGWFFDYSAGVLNFNDTSVPSGVTDTNIYIVGYRYIGQTGAPTSGISTFSYLDLTVERNLDVGVQGGISTFRNNIDANGDLDVDGNTFLDHVNVSQHLRVQSGGGLQVIGITTSGVFRTAGGSITIDDGGVSDTVGNAAMVMNEGTMIYTKEDHNGLMRRLIGKKDDVISIGSSGTGFINSINLFPGNAGPVNLFHGTNSSDPKIFTQIGGVKVNGTTRTDNLVVLGVSTTLSIDANGDLDVDGHTNLDNVSISGVTTATVINATTFVGNGDFVELDVDGHTNLDNVSVAGVSTFTGDASFIGNVSIGGTLTYEDVKNVDAVGLITARSGIRVLSGVIEAQAGQNKIPSLYSAMSDLPSASTYHGMFAHVHATGRGYFAHANNWYELVNADLTGRVGTGTESYFIDRLVSTSTTATSLNVTGVTTAITVDINGDLDVDGHTNLDNVSVAGVSTLSGNLTISKQNAVIELSDPDSSDANYQIRNDNGTFDIKDSTNSTVKIRATSSYVTIYPNLNANNGLDVMGLATFADNIDANGDLDVDGHTNLDNVSVAGVSTFSGTVNTSSIVSTGIDLNGDLDVDGHTNLDNVSIAGVTTFTGNIDANGDLDVDGHTNLDNVSVAGVSTFAGITTVTGNTLFTKQLNVSGVSTFSDDVKFTGANYNVLWDKSNSRLDFDADAQLRFQGNSFRIYNDGSGTSFIKNTAINLRITSDIFRVRKNNDSTHYINCHSNRVELYQSGNEKFRTTSTGITVTGTVVADGADINGDIDVDGHTNLDNVSIAGVTTFANNVDINANLDTTTLNAGNSTFTGTINAGNTVGSNGYYLKSTGIGVTWQQFPVARTTQTFTASGGQTTFSFTYNVNYIDVFVNGTKLTSSEFTATNGTSVVLAVGCFVGDIVDLFSYNVVASGGGLGLNNIVEDVTPQLGGNLDLFSKTITGTGNINMTGVATATKFVGDGSGLTGIVASGSGVVVKDNGSAVGTAGTINFGTNLDVSDISAGIVTVTAAGISTANIISDTITSGTLNVTGVSTFSEGLFIPDTKKIEFGNAAGNADLEIVHDTNNSVIRDKGTGSLTLSASGINFLRYGTADYYAQFIGGGKVDLRYNGDIKFETTASGIDVTGTAVNDGMVCAGVGTFSGLINANANIKRATGNLDINASNIVLKNAADSATYASFNNGGNVELHFNNVKRFETTNTGAVVAGIMTATSFSGDGSALTGISGVGTDNVRTNTLEVVGVSTFTGNIDANGDLDVDGHTNLDNLIVAGVSTFVSDVNVAENIIHTGDTDTKINFPSAGNIITLHTNGEERVRIAQNGSVGLGTNNPEARVDIYDDNTSIAGLLQLSQQGTGDASINFQIKGAQEWTIGADNSDDDKFKISSTAALGFNDGDAVIITTAGNVSIVKDFDVDGHTNLDNVSIAGVCTAANFVGDGSGLTNVVGSGSGVIVQHDGSNIGTAGTINFSTNLDVSAISAGIVTVTASGGGGADVGITTNLSGTFTASAGTPSTINTFTGYSSDDLVVEYTVYIKNGSDFQTQKLLAMRDGTTIHSTQFAVMFSSSLLVQCDATISSGNILLRATPETGVSGSTTYKVKREVM